MAVTTELVGNVGYTYGNASRFDHSGELDQISGALSAAQGEFEAVAKDSANPFFKSKYAGLPAIVKTASPILASHGLSITQLLGHDGTSDTLTTVLLHKSGQFIADTMQLRPIKNDPQAQGSAVTYGRRYSYMAILGLVADEDDDGNAGPGNRTAKPAAKPVARKPAPSTYKPEKPADAPVEAAPVTASTDAPAGEGVVDKVRAAAVKYKKSPDWLMLRLVELEADVTAINEAADGDAKKAAIAAAIAGLKLGDVILLVESMGGTAEDLA